MQLQSLCCRMQISKAVTSGVTVRVTSLVAVVAAGAAIHLLYLAFNIAATSALRLGGSGQEGEGCACHCRNSDVCQMPEGQALHAVCCRCPLPSERRRMPVGLGL